MKRTMLCLILLSPSFCIAMHRGQDQNQTTDMSTIHAAMSQQIASTNALMQLLLNQKQTHQPPINVYVTNSTSSTAASETAQHTEQITETTQKTAQEQHNAPQTDEKSKQEEAPANLIKWYHHRFKIFFGSLASSYGMLAYSMYVWNKKINNQESWCNWRSDLPAESWGTKHESLTRELITDIEHKYILISDPANNMAPFKLFMRDLEREEQAIAWYLFAAWILQKMRLARLFRINPEKIKKARKAQKRVARIKGIYKQWMVQYKLTHNKLLDAAVPAQG